MVQLLCVCEASKKTREQLAPPKPALSSGGEETTGRVPGSYFRKVQLLGNLPGHTTLTVGEVGRGDDKTESECAHDDLPSGGVVEGVKPREVGTRAVFLSHY